MSMFISDLQYLIWTGFSDCPVPDDKTGEVLEGCSRGERCVPCSVFDRSVRRVRKPWERLRVQSVPIGETRTIDSLVDQTDINRIIGKYHRTGQLPDGNGPGQFMDVTELQGTYIELHNKAQQVVETTNELSSQAVAAKRAKAAKAKADSQVVIPPVVAPGVAPVPSNESNSQ